MPKSVLSLVLFGLLTSLTLGRDAPPDQPDLLGPGDHTRRLSVGEQQRTYLVHVPKGHDASKPAPVVLVLHGTAMNGRMMAWFTGLSRKSDEAGFIAVYPNGTGAGPFLTWNSGGVEGMAVDKSVDEVAFVGKLLDDLGTVIKVESRRVYACGMSNGGMMCYRLAAELSDRIAAIAPVAGAIGIEESRPRRPVPVIHFHGTKDPIVPFEMVEGKGSPFMRLKSVEDSVQTWVKLNGCNGRPRTDMLSREGDTMKVTRKTYGGGRDGAEVVLIIIKGGGHAWPGRQPPTGLLGRSPTNISANDLIWEFFQKHSRE